MKLPTNKTQFILASTSRARRQILENYNIKAQYVSHDVDEEKEICKNKKLQEKLAAFLARKKIDSIQDQYKKSLIIGSDQIIVCENILINKPVTEEEAIRNLLILQNNIHTLISAICVLTPGGKYVLFEDTAKVQMKKICKLEIEKYVKQNKDIVYETSGSYKIENDKLKCITKVEGDNETILGFPIKKALPLLRSYIT